MNTDSKLVQLGRDFTYSHGLVNTPVYRGSTVTFKTVDDMFDESRAMHYGRLGSPTTNSLAEVVTSLEHGYGTVLACSGLAAITLTMTALAHTGSHVLISSSSYSPAQKFAVNYLAEKSVHVEFFDANDYFDIRNKLRNNTAMVYVDALSVIDFSVPDIELIVSVANCTPVVVDNSWGTPLYFNPLRCGASVVIHSASKYLSGHSDSIAGTITLASKELHDRVANLARLFGQYVSPDEAYSVMKGIRTLKPRMDRHFQNAMEVATWLSAQPSVGEVFYPPLENSAGHAIWKRLYQGASGLMGFSLRSENAVAKTVIENCSVCALGWGWGGYESLISPAQQVDGAISKFRLSVGLEDSTDIIEDLTRILTS